MTLAPVTPISSTPAQDAIEHIEQRHADAIAARARLLTKMVSVNGAIAPTIIEELVQRNAEVAAYGQAIVTARHLSGGDFPSGTDQIIAAVGRMALRHLVRPALSRSASGTCNDADAYEQAAWSYLYSATA